MTTMKALCAIIAYCEDNDFPPHLIEAINELAITGKTRSIKAAFFMDKLTVLAKHCEKGKVYTAYQLGCMMGYKEDVNSLLPSQLFGQHYAHYTGASDNIFEKTIYTGIQKPAIGRGVYPSGEHYYFVMEGGDPLKNILSKKKIADCKPIDFDEED